LYKALITDENDWDGKHSLVIHFENFDSLKDNIDKIRAAADKTIVEKKKVFYDLDLSSKK
jgi:hypothetical protein